MDLIDMFLLLRISFRTLPRGNAVEAAADVRFSRVHCSINVISAQGRVLEPILLFLQLGGGIEMIVFVYIIGVFVGGFVGLLRFVSCGWLAFSTLLLSFSCLTHLLHIYTSFLDLFPLFFGPP